MTFTLFVAFVAAGRSWHVGRGGRFVGPCRATVSGLSPGAGHLSGTARTLPTAARLARQGHGQPLSTGPWYSRA
ncbi:hypothetical protein FsymDg_4435 [Candidatus Protofrankia datiscae]|uniref:Uncharacterized protein n=1 Tax=Candidatus Protofrankia datiscae TaxID=2716812 RepID=F8AZE7_9ACTN|nr:hypothetical protein FsymDg_4435 [Candidatus Protofrankia datiscae]